MFFRYTLSILLVCGIAQGQTVLFGDSDIEVEFVPVWNTGNSADEQDFRGDQWGAVYYPYRIAKHETNCELAVEILSTGDVCTRPDIPKRFGYEEAIEFVNLLNTDRGVPRAYQFDTSGSGRTLLPWDPSESGYDPRNPLRNSLARFVLPTADEWYKAAYYDPESESYFDYATGTNEPHFASGNTLEDGVFVFGQMADSKQAGGLSPYGTMGQTGNAAEWHEPPLEPSVGLAWAGIADSLHQQMASQSHRASLPTIGLRIVDLLIENVVGDFDGDGLLTADDIDLLSEQVRSASEDLSFDLNSDGVLDSLDHAEWVEELANTSFGDSDLDGEVAFNDFLVFANNFEQPSGWAGGDFDGNGMADFQDFLALAINFGATASDVVSVPEPASSLMLYLGVLGLLPQRRRR